MSKKQLLIFPLSPTAIEALDCLGNEWDCVGLITDDAKQVGTKKFGYPIFDRSIIEKKKDARLLMVHGSPNSFLKRKEIIHQFKLAEEQLATVIHPNATISSRATIGKNVLIMAGVVITANAQIKDHVIILPNTVVHHDSIIGRYCLVGANVTIAGDVVINQECYIGAASSIKNGLRIKNKCLVGIGSNVVKNIDDENITVVGNPASTL